MIRCPAICPPGPLAIGQWEDSSVSGLLPDFWIKADAIVGKSDGDTIGGNLGDPWIDSSGNGHPAFDFVLIDPSPGSQLPPIYKTNIQNGKPAILLGLLAGMFSSYTLNASASFTMFAACRVNDLTSVGRRLVNTGGLAGGHNWLIGPYSGFWQFYDSTFITGPAIDLNPTLLTVSQETAASNFWVNETLIGTNLLPPTWPGAFGLGNTAINEDFLGYVFEVVAWNSILSVSDRNRVSASLRSKWAI